jgi:hypothetical protein
MTTTKGGIQRFGAVADGKRAKFRPTAPALRRNYAKTLMPLLAGVVLEELVAGLSLVTPVRP